MMHRWDFHSPSRTLIALTHLTKYCHRSFLAVSLCHLRLSTTVCTYAPCVPDCHAECRPPLPFTIPSLPLSCFIEFDRGGAEEGVLLLQPYVCTYSMHAPSVVIERGRHGKQLGGGGGLVRKEKKSLSKRNRSSTHALRDLPPLLWSFLSACMQCFATTCKFFFFRHFSQQIPGNFSYSFLSSLSTCSCSYLPSALAGTE